MIQIGNLNLNATSKLTSERPLLMRSRSGSSFFNSSTLTGSSVQLEFYQLTLTDSTINATLQQSQTFQPSLVVYTNTTLTSMRNLFLSSSSSILLLSDLGGISLLSNFSVISVSTEVLISTRDSSMIRLANGAITSKTLKIDIQQRGPAENGGIARISQVNINASEGVNITAVNGNVSISEMSAVLTEKSIMIDSKNKIQIANGSSLQANLIDLKSLDSVELLNRSSLIGFSKL